ncbi:MAG: PhzF family phenazine biosynthesis protein [Thermoplasmatota archaeon]
MREVYIVDAFTEQSFTGNPAGVVPQADGLTDESMQRIAAELRCSETAFILESDDAYLRIRFFTPVREVDLCGHATIAAFHVLATTTELPRQITMETHVGVLPVGIRSGAVYMQQAQPAFRSLDIDTPALADALGLDESAIAGLPIEAASTGLWSLNVPLVSRTAIRHINPDFADIEDICIESDVGALFAFTFDTVDEKNLVHSRCFAPCYGVNEDPVTGTANGALGAYLRRHDLLESMQYTAEQGYELGRPGIVHVDVSGSEVWVGGSAVTTVSGHLNL